MNQESSNPDVDSVSRGEVFPSEFLGAIQETASITLEQYLRSYHAPEVVIDCLRDLIFLQDLMTEDPDEWRPTGRAGWNLEMQAAVSRMAWEIRLLGGIFHGPYSESHRHEGVKWEGCNEPLKG